MRKYKLHPRTLLINKSQKGQCRQARQRALAWLSESFPKAFDAERQIRPLKIGIMQDILQHADRAEAAGISKSKLREALVVFTRRIDYLACLKAREMRIDLDGNPVAAVTDEDAESAALKIRKLIEKNMRNARKKELEMSGLPEKKQSKMPKPEDDYLPTYPKRSVAAPIAPVSNVVITHKTTRQFDPEAVARLKAKLGISRGADGA